MSKEKLTEIRSRAQRFTQDNFVQLCRDILERRESLNKGICREPQGKFNELIAICAEIPTKGARMVAEGLVESEAILRGARSESDF